MHAYIRMYIRGRQIECFGPSAGAQGALNRTTPEHLVHSRPMWVTDVEVLAVHISRIAISAMLASARAAPTKQSVFVSTVVHGRLFSPLKEASFLPLLCA